MIEPLASILAVDVLVLLGIGVAVWHAVRPRTEYRGVRPWTR